VGKVILLLCLAGLVFGAYIVDQPDATRGYDACGFGPSGAYNYKNMGVYVSVCFCAGAGSQTFQAIQFDTLNAIPHTAIIDSAIITYTLWFQTSSSVVSTAQILTYWGEGVHNQTNATTGEMSWNCDSFPQTWTAGGCNGIGTDRTAVLDSQVLATPYSNPTKIYVTATTQAIVSSGTNYGYYQNAPSADQIFGSSSDNGTALKRPKLEVWYPDVPVLIAMKWRGYYDGKNLRTWGIK